ncbi:MAG: hypothetical protein HYR96_08790 [Deltaproteobacteria bacterium]|nr:hypothetical protein [Deltaproteobacteria bacterium]MBI3294932.1 hypothetical protein [Deltaproteobacteria bacterium]
MSYTQGCIQFWNDLRALDTRDRKGLPEGGRCSSIPPELTQRHEAYLKECVKSQRSDSFECEQALLTYRVHLGEWLTQNTKLAEIHDQKVLTDKLMARLDLHSNTKVTEVAKRLLELNPDMMPAAQALLTSALMEAQEAIGNPRDDRWSAVEEALLRNEKISGNARQAMDVSLMVEQQRYRDPIRLREKASEVSRSHPELGIGPYYAAWAEKQNGDEVRAKELLEEAVRREPNDPRFREALRTMNFQPAPITFALQP